MVKFNPLVEFISLLDRYIVRQMLLPFGFGIAVFTALGLFVGVLFGLIRLVAEKGLPLWVAVQILGLRTPSFVVLAIPMSVLLTTLLVYGNLSRHGEITALRAAGIHRLRLALPAVLASIVVAGLTLGISDWVVPAASFQAATTQAQAMHQQQPQFQQKNIFYRDFEGKRLAHIFFARSFDGQQMQRISLLQFEQGQLQQIVTATTGRWNEQTQMWDFGRGTLYSLENNGVNNYYRKIENFEQQQIRLPRTPLELASETRRVTQMNLADAHRFLRLVEQTGDPKRTQKIRLEIQQKLSLPWACLAFGLVGTALGMRPQRGNEAPGFGLSVVIIFGYYILSYALNALGEGQVISPLVAAWFPELSCLLVGLRLLWTIER
jgi:lipopolysaccharide export system permease protein